jgi:GT2 family glycosyltransferase
LPAPADAVAPDRRLERTRNIVLLAVDILLLLLALPVLGASAYLLLLTAMSWRSTAAAPRPLPPRLRFDVVVPAHDEQSGIEATVRSLRALDYPRALFRVRVVADNCADATAARARAAGAEVLERRDPRRGKGHALRFAFDRSLADGLADAVVVVDADTVASPELLRAFAARLEAGATVVQARNAVGNPDASWRTRLLAIAFTLFNDVRSLGRERLRVSAGLRGNGMCLAAQVLREVPHDAFGIVEDVEYGIRLGEAGHRVAYAAEACVLSQMPATGRAARTQRRRWQEGRRALRRRWAGALLRRGIAARDPVLLDLGADLLVPPLGALSAGVLAGGAAAAVGSWLAGRPLASLVAWAAAALALVVHVTWGWWRSGTGARGLADLLLAPVYVAWKAALAVLPREGARSAWLRTARAGELR